MDRSREPEFSLPYSLANDMRRNRFWIILALTAVWVLGTFLMSESAAKKKEVVRTVSGMVLDQEENPIAGAVVEMTDLQNGKKLAIYTSDDGHYLFSNLDARHDYHLQASYKGLSSEIRTASSFDTSNRVILNFKIPKS